MNNNNQDYLNQLKKMNEKMLDNLMNNMMNKLQRKKMNEKLQESLMKNVNIDPSKQQLPPINVPNLPPNSPLSNMLDKFLNK